MNMQLLSLKMMIPEDDASPMDLYLIIYLLKKSILKTREFYRKQRLTFYQTKYMIPISYINP